MLPLGGGQIYCYADVNAEHPVDPIDGDPSNLVELYSDFAQPVALMEMNCDLPCGNPLSKYF